MALNVRLALGICLTSIGGICWLVERVARPIVELPSPLSAPALVSAGDAAGPSLSSQRAAPTADAVAERFERPSLIHARPQSGAATVLVASTGFSGGAPEGPNPLSATLPPLRSDSGADEPVWLPPLAHAPEASAPEPIANLARVSDSVAAAPSSPVLASKQRAVRPARNEIVGAEPKNSPALARHSEPAAAVPEARISMVVGPAEANAANPPAAEPTRPRDSAPAALEYVVQRGDSLSAIAKKTLGSAGSAEIRALLAANRGLARNPDHIVVGQKLVVPAPAGSGGAKAGVPVAAAGSTPQRSPKPVAGGSPAVAVNEPGNGRAAAKEPSKSGSAKSGRAATSTSTKPGGVVHSSKPAARTEPARSAAGQAANSAEPAVARRLASGAKAKGKAAGSAGDAMPADAYRWYTIRKDDSLQKIARQQLKNERRWMEIQRLNQLPSGDRIEAGRRIKLPAPVADET